MGSRFSNLRATDGEELTVATSGTPVQGSDIQVPKGIELLITADIDNTGTVTIASTSAGALNTNTTGKKLLPGQEVGLLMTNRNKVFADSTVSGDKVRLFAEFGG